VKQLIHHGILIPTYEAQGFQIAFKTRTITLTPQQEEMALAWVKKLDTEYVEDPTFVTNFFSDFRQALGVHGKGSPTDFDFLEIQAYCASEQRRKEALPKEERKRAARLRRETREALKEIYGYATVDGERIEVSNYTAEPSSIFMGRGRHPLRGKWKQGPQQNDVVLNLSPDAPPLEDGWKGREWHPDAMWIAKWKDKLGGMTKYVWLADSFSVKQKREQEKFDRAQQLKRQIGKVRGHITRNLRSPDPLRRKIATVCYLIDALKLRVGDEKDPDEADTVGATTLKPEHISFHATGVTTFDFLGKDSVHWHLEARLPDPVVHNIRLFCDAAESPIFKGVRSDNVSSFLDEAMPGLTAKVFRTHHATTVVDEALKATPLSPDAPDFLKKHVAKMANLEAAKTCNHKKKPSKNWANGLTKMEARLKVLKEKKRAIQAKETRKEETKRKRLATAEERIRKLATQIELKKATKEYNLNTSLKSYIDPRVYYTWAKQVGYDWRLCYSRALQRKFQWVESTNP
jgi:DNA topoisomerase-1